jgi:hypothetical protein
MPAPVFSRRFLTISAVIVAIIIDLKISSNLKKRRSHCAIAGLRR